LTANYASIDSRVPYISNLRARNIGWVIIIVVVLLGRLFSTLKEKGVDTLWLFGIIIVIAIIIYLIIKTILYYTSNRLNSF
jgi:hypothetical protein